MSRHVHSHASQGDNAVCSSVLVIIIITFTAILIIRQHDTVTG